MNNIKSYIILNKKTNNIINMFISISIMIIITLIVIIQFKYIKHYEIKGIVIKNNEEYKLQLYIDPDKLNVVKNNKKIIIEEKEYEYKISSIDNEYTINNYLKVTIDIKLLEKDKINNNILQTKIQESNKKLFYYIKNYLLKGEFKWAKLKKEI